MSRETSEGVGQVFSLERVCRELEFPRSKIYAQLARESAKVVALFAQRRAPKGVGAYMVASFGQALNA